jgi:hypothetical protein
VGSANLAGYEVEFRLKSVVPWQGFAGALGATSATLPTTEPTAIRVRAQARSGAISGWREAAVPAAPSGLAATAVVGGTQVSGSVPGGTPTCRSSRRRRTASLPRPSSPTSRPCCPGAAPASPPAGALALAARRPA